MYEIWLPGYGPRDAWSKKTALFAQTIYVREDGVLAEKCQLGPGSSPGDKPGQDRRLIRRRRTVRESEHRGT